MKYKNTLLYGMLLLLAGTFEACDNNGIDDLLLSICTETLIICSSIPESMVRNMLTATGQWLMWKP